MTRGKKINKMDMIQMESSEHIFDYRITNNYDNKYSLAQLKK